MAVIRPMVEYSKTETDVIVTFYFVSGLSTELRYPIDHWKKTVKHLQNNWMNMNNAAEAFGINFSFVTHFTVKKS